MRSGRTPAANVDAAAKMIAEAKAGIDFISQVVWHVTSLLYIAAT
jgi:hypothetical protein